MKPEYKHTARRRNQEQPQQQVINLADWAENTFSCTVSDSIYQGAVFKATEIMQIKSNKNKLDGNLTLPPGGGGDDVIVNSDPNPKTQGGDFLCFTLNH